MTAKHVASHFSQVFSEYGWPDTLLTDNGPCYAAQEFKQLTMDMSVNHITSSPHYPQSNGLAEKYVQIVKNLSIKAYEEGTDYQKALMIYRNQHWMITCFHQCSSCREEQLDQTSQCHTQLRSNMALPVVIHYLHWLKLRIRMKELQPMTTSSTKMSCIWALLARSGSQLLLFICWMLSKAI